MIRRKILFLFLLIFLAGCKSLLINRSAPPTRDANRYFGPTWVGVDQAVLKADDLTLGIHYVAISPQQTRMLFSASGLRSGNLTKADFGLVDDQNARLSLRSLKYLDPLENINFGVMEFEARLLGAQALFLQYTDRTGKTAKVPVAKLVHPEGENRLQQTAFGLVTRLELNGYRISPSSGDFIPLSTPIPEDLQTGSHLVLSLKGINNPDEYFYTFDFLINGEVVGSISKR